MLQLGAKDIAVLHGFSAELCVQSHHVLVQSCQPQTHQIGLSSRSAHAVKRNQSKTRARTNAVLK